LVALPPFPTRRSSDLDGFARAAVEGFVWAVLSGVCGKLAWDSTRLPLFFYPLAVIDGWLLWDGVRSYLRARAQLRAERAALRRLDRKSTRLNSSHVAI